jgi:hypothetical protein
MLIPQQIRDLTLNSEKTLTLQNTDFEKSEGDIELLTAGNEANEFGEKNGLALLKTKIHSNGSTHFIADRQLFTYIPPQRFPARVST